jgi:hypothetical protein
MRQSKRALLSFFFFPSSSRFGALTTRWSKSPLYLADVFTISPQ